MFFVFQQQRYNRSRPINRLPRAKMLIKDKPCQRCFFCIYDLPAKSSFKVAAFIQFKQLNVSTNCNKNPQQTNKNQSIKKKKNKVRSGFSKL
jgi:hypothetical protein